MHSGTIKRSRDVLKFCYAYSTDLGPNFHPLTDRRAKNIDYTGPPAAANTMASTNDTDYNNNPLDPSDALRIQLDMYDLDEAVKKAIIAGDNSAIQQAFANIVRNLNIYEILNFNVLQRSYYINKLDETNLPTIQILAPTLSDRLAVDLHQYTASWDPATLHTLRLATFEYEMEQKRPAAAVVEVSGAPRDKGKAKEVESVPAAASGKGKAKEVERLPAPDIGTRESMPGAASGKGKAKEVERGPAPDGGKRKAKKNEQAAAGPSRQKDNDESTRRLKGVNATTHPEIPIPPADSYAPSASKPPAPGAPLPAVQTKAMFAAKSTTAPAASPAVGPRVSTPKLGDIAAAGSSDEEDNPAASTKPQEFEWRCVHCRKGKSACEIVPGKTGCRRCIDMELACPYEETNDPRAFPSRCQHCIMTGKSCLKAEGRKVCEACAELKYKCSHAKTAPGATKKRKRESQAGEGQKKGKKFKSATVVDSDDEDTVKGKFLLIFNDFRSTYIDYSREVEAGGVQRRQKDEVGQGYHELGRRPAVSPSQTRRTSSQCNPCIGRSSPGH